MNKAEFKKALIQRGLTQSELAKLLGMSKNNISYKVNGKVEITTTEAKEWIRILRVTDPKQKCAIFLD